MLSEPLQRARTYVQSRLPAVSANTLPVYHVTGGVGWINDPNGFSVYKGEYHLFFQYYPYAVTWGPMHWGHVKSKDFLRWERLPVALAPDMPYDRDGCFSGSAAELPDGRHILLYTGVQKTGGVPDCYQTQCIAIGDGIDYEKYPGNPVLTADGLPAGGSARDFRDPKLWREGDKWYAVMGNRTPDGSGAVLLYESDDAIHWRYAGTLAECKNEFGKMWECPDFFLLDGKAVLLTSPQEMFAAPPEFHNGGGSLCLIGDYDRENQKLLRERAQAIDYGFDFYAPQTLETPDGRRILIGWMQSWETSSFRREDLPFCGQMTLPRELRIRDGRLIQNPVRELEKYRTNRVVYQNVSPDSEGMTLPGVGGRVLDLTVTLRPLPGGALYGEFRLDIVADGQFFTRVSYRPERQTIRIDRTHSGFPYDIPTVRDVPVAGGDGQIKLRILLDRWSMELFVNDGEQAASCVLYTPQTADSIRFSADGALIMDVEQYAITT